MNDQYPRENQLLGSTSDFFSTLLPALSILGLILGSLVMNESPLSLKEDRFGVVEKPAVDMTNLKLEVDGMDAGEGLLQSANVIFFQNGGLELQKVADTLRDSNNDGIIWIGDTITYNFLIVNCSSEGINNINITDPLFADPIVCEDMMLAAGDSTTCVGTKVITAADVVTRIIVNQATVTGSGTGSVPMNYMDVSDDPLDPTSPDDDPTVVEIPCPSLACVSDLNYSIPNSGKIDLSPEALGYPEIYELELFDMDGNAILDSMVDCTNGSERIKYTITHPCGVTCWGYINIENKNFPEFDSPCEYIPSASDEAHIEVRDSLFVTLNEDGTVASTLGDTVVAAQVTLDSTCQDLNFSISSSVKHFSFNHAEDLIDWTFDSIYYEVIKPDSTIAFSGILDNEGPIEMTYNPVGEIDEGLYTVRIALNESSNQPDYYTTNGPEGQVWVSLSTTHCIPENCDTWCPSTRPPDNIITKEELQDSLHALPCLGHLEVKESTRRFGEFCDGEDIVVITHSTEVEGPHETTKNKILLIQAYRIVQPIAEKEVLEVEGDIQVACGDSIHPWAIFEKLVQDDINSYPGEIDAAVLNDIRKTAAKRSFPHIYNIHDTVDVIFTREDAIVHKLVPKDSLVKTLKYYNSLDSMYRVDPCSPNTTSCIPVWVLDTITTYTLKEVIQDVTDTLAVPEIVPLYDVHICGYSTKYEDQVLNKCGGSKHIARTWTVLDWCEQSERTISSQIIRVRDTIAPEIITVGDIELVMDPWTCSQSIDLPEIGAIDECSDIGSVSYEVIGSAVIEGNAITVSADTDVYVVITVYDECDNMAMDTFEVKLLDFSKPVAISKDAVNVSLVGSEEGIGIAKVTPEVVNQESHDSNCGDVEFCVIRHEDFAAGEVWLPGNVRWSTDGETINDRSHTEMLVIEDRIAYNAVNPCYSETYTEYYHDADGDIVGSQSFEYVTCREYAKFCCADIGDSTSVALLVTDEAGNTSVAWTKVNVEDKSGVGWSCNEKEITCDEVCDFNPPTPSYGGILCDVKQVVEISRREDIVCGVGTLAIEWAALDDDGREISRTVCTYPVANPDGVVFDPRKIKWPKHYDGRRLDGINKECYQGEIQTSDTEVDMGPIFTCAANEVLDEPVWCQTSCTLILSSYEDFNEDASCGKIIRQWTVIDWCLWRPNGGSPDEDSTQPSGGDLDNDTFVAVEDWTIGEDCDECPKKSGDLDRIYFEYASDENGNIMADIDGYYTFDQAIQVVDNDAPVITVEDAIITTNSGYDGSGDTPDYSDCVASGEATASVEDFCLGLSTNTRVVLRWRFLGETGLGPIVPLTDLPVGTYQIDWTAQDACGNVSNASQNVIVQDVGKPQPFCLGGISIAFMEAGEDQLPAATIWASDYDYDSYDNCSSVMFYFKDDAGNKHPSLSFGCEDLENGISELKEIEVYVGDEAGNEDFCVVQVRIDDAGDHCFDIDQGGVLIGGSLSTELGDRIETAVVALNDQNMMVTGVEGTYAFDNNAIYNDYTVTPEKNDDHLNGVSTLDIVLMQRHILGIEFFDSPYKIIAGDINSDHKISALDLVQMRKLVLGLYDQFPDNTSWRFVDANQEFDNIFNPFPFKEYVEIDQLLADEMHQNFIGVKIGDVSGNAIANSAIHSGGRTQGYLDFFIAASSYEAGEKVEISVTADNFSRINAFQFTLLGENLVFENIVPGAIDVDEGHFAIIQEDLLTMAWTHDRILDKIDNSLEGLQIGKDEVLFTIIAHANRKGEISESTLQLNSNVTRSTAYQGSGEELLPQLHFSESIQTDEDVIVGEIKLYQNTPNPFNDETVISFAIPKRGLVQLTVFDQAGRILFNHNQVYEKGMQTLQLNADQVGGSGLMYYQMDFGEFTSTRKMLLIE